MILKVKVIPGARKNLMKQDALQNKIYLTAPAQEGRANAALIDFLSQHFSVPKKDIDIIRGLKSRQKTVHIKNHNECHPARRASLLQD